VNKDLYNMSNNPENLVKIGPVDSEISGLESRPLKIKTEKNTSKPYMPGGLYNFYITIKWNYAHETSSEVLKTLKKSSCHRSGAWRAVWVGH